MRVGILTVRGRAGEEGGAERFFAGLQRAFVERGFDAELVAIPSDESTFDAIEETYLRCYDLDAASFDGVISTKAPTYLVRHPNHVCYLVHTVRVFYDMFEATFPGRTAQLLAQRALVHKLDTLALAPPRTRQVFAIGHEVAHRLARNNGIDAAVLHPPLGFDRLHAGPYGDYVFLPGRLHRWKRVDLAIEAMQHVRAPLRLLIAGSGEDEYALRALAAADTRIVFLGRVPDAELVDLYANALAVAFVPVREDYGYVTVEAFRSGKPVVTCSDSGEAALLVEHERTGLVVPPDPASLGAAFERLHADRGLVAALGATAAAQERTISWDDVVPALVNSLGIGERSVSVRSSALLPTIRVAVVDMQPITPAVGGGRLRLLGVYHALGPEFETTYVGTYDWPGERRRELRLTDSLTEIDVPLSAEHFRRDAQWRDFAGGATIIDTAFPMLGRLSQDFLDRARAAIAGADAVVFSHPWVHPLLADVVDRRRQLVVYDSHNVEALLRYDILGDTPFGREIGKGVAMTEWFLARDADVVVGCSTEDVSFYHDAYGVPRERMWVVPNGVFVKSIVAPSPGERASAKAALGIAGPAVVFIGSNYGPNVEAAEFIAHSIAPALPEVTFLVCGGVGDTPSVGSETRPNVRVTGRVSDEEKLRLLQAADVALNPMFSGSGTNIKMFDFMAAGLPVVSTVTGVRGICDTTTRGIAVCAPESIAGELARLVEDAALRQRLGADNRRWVEKDFAWEALSPMFGAIVRRALEQRRTTPPARLDEKPVARADAPGVAGQLAPSGTPAPRVAILSTLGIRCGIAEYTTYLTEALLAAGAEVTIVANLLDGHEAATVPPPAALGAAAVERVWRYDNTTWTQSRVNAADVARLLRVQTIGHLNVQYHRGFFPEPMLLELLRTVTAAGVTVSLSLHNSSDATAGFLAQLATIPVAVLVHRPAERDRLRGLGIAHAQFFPFGVRPAVTVENPGLPFVAGDADPLLATFGFLRPHKGLLELIDALQILRGVFPGIRLLAQTALYPSTDSMDYLERVKARIAEIGLGDAVHLDHSFVDINVAIARLARAKAVVLPYGVSDEGASAAAATALASRRPLITTQARIFDEVRGVAYMAEDNSPPVLAAAIAAALSIPGLCRHLENQSHRVAEDRQWRNVAQQLLRIVDAGRPVAGNATVSAPDAPTIVSTQTS